jgi:uncharacterized membrane protein
MSKAEPETATPNATAARPAQPPRRRLLKPWRIMRARPRLFISALVGLALYLALGATDWRLPARLLASWDIFVVLYTVLVSQAMASSDVNHMRRRARTQDEGQMTILALTALAGLASLGAIVALLGSVKEAEQPALQLAFAMLTIMLSWAFTHIIFALHYAHEYYDENAGKGGGLTFPNEKEPPDYWDFMYVSFTVGMCAQVSDVGVSCKRIRRTVLAHSIISFIFNAALVALTVNIAASAI